ncbi:hypothetical protein ABZV77_04010 [Streptomyces sp. NPDC004732]|uniref:hypothetical protein n=1 Tax=Streptomyces sp. NPDC004732 TaxID=3154290 RepID=UPI0033A29051
MSGQGTVREGGSYVGDGDGSGRRYVIWHTAGETLVFDRRINCPADVGDEALPELLRRLREAGVPETDAYPGRPCA